MLLRDTVPLTVGIGHRKRTSQRNPATGGKHQGRWIRHASPTTALPIVALAIAVVRTSFRRLLVAAVGQASLLSANLPSTQRAAVVLPPIAVAADPEDLATLVGTAKSLTEDNFGADRHPRPKVGLDNGERSWQVETIVDGGNLMKVCHTGNPAVFAAGFLLPTCGDQGTR